MNYVATSPEKARPIETMPRHRLMAEEGQSFLLNAKRDGLLVWCMCQNPSRSPLVVQQGSGDKLHIQSKSNTSHEHSPRCFHGDVSRLARSYGLPSGSLSVAGGQLVIDLQSMFPDSTSTSTSATGTGSTFTPPNHGKSMYALGMLLLAEAGLLTFHGGESQLDSWGRLQAAARSISVKDLRGSTSLENFLLVPKAVYNQQLKRNRAKLLYACEARHKTGRLLFATALPSSPELRAPGSELSLYESHNVFLTVGNRVLARAWNMFTHAEAHHRHGRPVLAFGLATVKRGDEGIKVRVTQLALIPVGALLTPTPTSGHWHALQERAARGDAYGIELDQDWFFGLCCSGG